MNTVLDVLAYGIVGVACLLVIGSLVAVIAVDEEIQGFLLMFGVLLSVALVVTWALYQTGIVA